MQIFKNNKITTWLAMIRNLKIFKIFLFSSHHSLLSVLKRCIGVGVGVAGCMPTTKRSSLCIFSLHIGRQRCPCCFVSSPAAFEAKKKEQLLSCIFTSPDSQDSGKSIDYKMQFYLYCCG
ncbi:hypothetical protein T4B_3025 [Trichinella pseudospiralis]|uniref:Uncharacterized protein n=1 Tax=Trichinella pseudospiralis TaxID=6337 RepID=A0A0V1IMU3_TRIPS|nr:hypothetical protein T4B_3025 [Trichinella pseudospiralis]